MRHGRYVAAAAGSALAALLLSACTTDAHVDNPPPTGGGISSTLPTGDTPTGPQVNQPPSRPSRTDLVAAASTPLEDPYYPETSNPEVDALHYDLDLTWDGTVLDGRATVILRAATGASTLRLDLSAALRTSRVALDGAPITFRQAGDGLLMDAGAIEKGSEHTLTIDYRGRPEAVPAPSQRDDQAGGLGWTVDAAGAVSTFQEPYGAFTWYPVNDHPSDKALYDAHITVPQGNVAVFNGTLVTHRAAGPAATEWTWHLDAPAASYLTTVAIGPYAAYHDTMPDGTPATYWVLPQDRARVTQLERESRVAFEWLTRHAGSYPFDTFGVVLVGGDGGMETQTMITLSPGSLDRPDAVLEHEIAHQWFGDAVTPTDWQGLWLSEGWAMYMQHWFEQDTGRYEYGGGMARWRPLDNASRGRSGPPGDFDPRSFGDVNVYLGPALMLDAIRRQVGDAEFGSLVKAWVTDHADGNVDRAEFVSWLNKRTGQDLTTLVDTWLDSPSTPR